MAPTKSEDARQVARPCSRAQRPSRRRDRPAVAGRRARRRARTTFTRPCTLLGGSSATTGSCLRDEMVVLGPGGDVAVDVDAFMAAAGAVDGTPASIVAALAQWTGELLPEDLYEDWASSHREQLANRRARLVVQLASALIAEGEVGEAVLALEPLAVERPDDEEIHRVLLEALFASGRRGDAAQAFDRLRNALEEYGGAPSRATVDLYRRLCTGSASGRAVVANNMPASTTSFVGRQRELRDLTSALDRSRLVTITGPGGAGKTRLALELARRRAATLLHPDGVWVVDLAGVTDRDLVASAVATALDLQLPGRRPSASVVVDQLAGRHLLLVLDNCEHLLRAITPLVGELLARCPDLVVLPPAGSRSQWPGRSPGGRRR